MKINWAKFSSLLFLLCIDNIKCYNTLRFPYASVEMDSKGARQWRSEHIIFKEHSMSSSGKYSENHNSCMTTCSLIYNATISPSKVPASFLKEKKNNLKLQVLKQYIISLPYF